MNWFIVHFADRPSWSMLTFGWKTKSPSATWCWSLQSLLQSRPHEPSHTCQSHMPQLTTEIMEVTQIWPRIAARGSWFQWSSCSSLKVCWRVFFISSFQTVGELGYVTDPTPIQFVPPRTSVITFPYHNQNHGSWAQREYNSQQYPIKIEPDQQTDRGGRRYDGNGRGPIDEYEFYHYGEPSDWENLSTPNLVGQTTVGGQSAPDLDGRTTHIWFAFNMLSIRTEGVFKLRFTLCDVMQMKG